MSTMSTEKKKKKFSRKQLRASQGLLTMQAKTNIFASQTGMTGFGAVRHGADIRADDLNEEGNKELTQMAATHIFASQKGMTCFGAVRHGKDIAVKELYEEGDDDEFPPDPEDEVRPQPVRKTRMDEPRQAEPVPQPEPEPEPEPEQTEEQEED